MSCFSKSAVLFQRFVTLTQIRSLKKSSVIVNSFVEMNETNLLNRAKTLAPPLANNRHKGQAGRIGIFGGSLEYTGAPYFAAISSLKVGADLVYVFCTKNAATVIKSYSPELIVLPHLDGSNAIEDIEPWLDRLHTVVIGPGLGRHDSIFRIIEKVISNCRTKKIPLVIDADGLFFISTKPEVIKDYPVDVVLTPNAMEFTRLVGVSGDGNRLEKASKFLGNVGCNVTLFCKDQEDEIISQGQSVKVVGGGSGRRCGGQGDLLSGALATFLTWSLQNSDNNNFGAAVACYAASKLTRSCNQKAFGKFGRSMTCTDMIKEIHDVFEENFEVK